MKLRLLTVGMVCCVIAFLAGCDKIADILQMKKPQIKEKTAVTAPMVKGTVIAKVNNTPITLEDLNQEIDAENAMVARDKPEAKITTRDQKISYLKDRLIRRTLLYQEALSMGLYRKDAIIEALEKTRQDLLVVELVREEAEKIDVTSKEIEDYYNTYKEQLKEPEERQIREIMVSSEPEAKEILIQLLQGADFATLAKEKSKAPSAKDGGDLGYIKKGTKPVQYDTVAFADSLEVGKISNIFKGSDGNYYVLKLEGRRGGQQKSLTELWEDIKRGLTFLKQEQKIEDLIGKLSREAKIEVYEGQIK